MPIKGTLFPWDKTNVYLVEAESATFALYHDNKLIYIGSTSDLSKTFREYWESKFNNKSCLKITNNYRREYRSDYQERADRLLREYKKMHGKLPRCNNSVESD